MLVVAQFPFFLIPDTMNRTLLRFALPAAVFAWAGMPTRSQAQSVACPTPSAATLDDVNTLKAILADTDSVRVAYRASLGLSGVSADSVMAVSDAAVCTSVTAAVDSYMKKDSSSAENLYVVKAGPRYVAFDSHGEDPSQYVLTLAFVVTHYLLP